MAMLQHPPELLLQLSLPPMNKVFFTLGATIILGASANAQQFWRTDGTSGTWTGANWGASGAGPFTTSYVANSDAQFTANSTVTFATAAIGNVTVDAGKIVTIAAGGTATFGAAGAGGLVRTFDIGSGATLTWQSQSITATSTAGLIKNGDGTLDLGSLTWTTSMNGGFTLNAGTLIVAGNKSQGNGALNLNGGTLQTSGSRDYTPTSIVIGGNFALAGTGNQDWDAATTISLGASTRTITNNTTSGSRQFRGLISGSPGAGLTFDGTGGAQLYIGNTGNTFTGPLAIDGGEVVFNDNGALGATTSITLDGGRLTMASMNTGGTASALTSATISSDKNIFLGSTAGTSISIQGATGVTTYNGVLADKAGSTGILVKQGAGTLVFGGSSTFTGNTFINNGTMKLSAGSDRLPTGTAVNLGQPASANLGNLDLNGQNQTLAGLVSTTGTNATTGNNTVTSATAATLTLGGSGTYSYGDGSNANSGVLTGSIGLVKTGSGTQTLGDTNTYTGGTTISGGTLVAANASAVGAGPVTVNGGTLATSVPTLNLGGSLGLGSGTLDPGQTAVGQFALAADSSFTMSGGIWNVTILDGSSFDSITGAGLSSLFEISGGTLDLTGSALALGDYNILSGFHSGSGNFGSITGYDGSQFLVSFDTTTPGVGQLHVTAVPEPGTYAFAVCALLLAISASRLRRSQASARDC